MMKKWIGAIVLTSFVLGAAPVSAGFFLEGLKAYTEEPRCTDPYATDKEGCERPDLSYPAPPPAKPEAKPDMRTRTREGLADK